MQACVRSGYGSRLFSKWIKSALVLLLHVDRVRAGRRVLLALEIIGAHPELAEDRVA